MSEKLLNEVSAAARLGLQIQTLRNWRHLRKGVPYVKIGERKIGYLEADIDDFIRNHRIEPNAYNENQIA
jgi:hypothetical protein